MDIMLTKWTKDEQGEAGVGLFVWQDGAMFQDVVNQEMGEMFPYGMDPTWTDDEMEGEIFKNGTGSPVELSRGGNAGFYNSTTS